MILIEVNNQDTPSNFQLLEKTEKWAKENIKGGEKYTIVLNPNIEGEIKLTKVDIETLGGEKGTV